MAYQCIKGNPTWQYDSSSSSDYIKYLKGQFLRVTRTSTYKHIILLWPPHKSRLLDGVLCPLKKR